MQTIHQSFTAILSNQDMKQHIPYRFQVPPGTRSLSIQMTYAPQRVDEINNLITLTLLDPAGFRGAAHHHTEATQVWIQEDAATPGFLPGALQPGEWSVMLDTHMIMPGTPVQVELAIAGDDQPNPYLVSLPARVDSTARPRRGPGWYRGDFHTHTVHSDGEWEVADLVAWALENRLDFLTLSDHNTISGLAQFERACPESLLPICGTELTTFWGHALALGRREWVDWRIAPGAREMSQVLQEVEAGGALFVIAHPKAVGDPYCTGCAWLYPDVSPGAARIVEVWNSPWFSASDNQAGLDLAFEWMNRGLRMVLTAGSDRHDGYLPIESHALNYVYAEELSEPAILRAVRLGRLILSSGPALTFSAQAGGKELMPGDSCRAPDRGTISISAGWENCPSGSSLELVVNGEKRATVSEGNSASWKLPGGQTDWALVTLRAPDEAMLAISNPIYFDGR